MPPAETSRWVNAHRPQSWKADVAASVDQFNRWFLDFAPATFRQTRLQTTQEVRNALLQTRCLREMDAVLLQTQPGVLPTLRMCTAPPLAVDRLVGLADVGKTLVARMEQGQLPTRMAAGELQAQLGRISAVLSRLLDRDIFPWLAGALPPTDPELDRAASVVPDRLCGAVANPIIRNAQEQRQLALMQAWLQARGYRQHAHPAHQALNTMPPGTYGLRMNVRVGAEHEIIMPVDVVIQPHHPRPDGLPVLIEAKSAGDFTNTNKRRKEEATKMHQLQARYGQEVCFVLLLCGYFGCDYLGYEAAEGIDWVWEHRIDDLAWLGL